MISEGEKPQGFLRTSFERVRPRMLPSLLILGAQKAGTSALFSMLSKHPKAAPPGRKELDFFIDDDAFAKGLKFYKAQFPAIPVRSFGHFTFEASPSYLYHAAVCAPRIARTLPEVICTAILRDPVKRAYSAWNMFRDFKGHPLRNMLHDPRSFAQAVEDELAGRTKEAYHKYLLRGQYTDQIIQFQAHIPPERLLVRSYLELKAEPETLVNQLLLALHLPPMPAHVPLKATRVHTVKYKEPLDPGLAQELYRYFEPELKRLNTALGREIQLVEPSR